MHRVSRRQLIGDLADGNTRQTRGVGPLDRLYGLAGAGALASAIKHLRASTRKFSKKVEKNNLGAAALNRTVYELADVLIGLSNSKAAGLPRDDVEKIALIGILECISPQCTTCNGRCEVTLVNGVVVQCDACNASGFRRYTDTDRKRIMGRWLTSRESKVLDDARSVYRHHDNLGESMTADRIYGDEL